MGDAVALHRRQRLAGVEAGEQGEAGADPQRGVHADRLPEGVEERQGAEDDVAGADSQVVREEISALRERLKWVSSAPFGLPVVPEV